MKNEFIHEIPNKFVAMDIVNYCIQKLYDEDAELFQRNLCERALVFRFALYLQNKLNDIFGHGTFYVDCDFNSSFEQHIDAQGNVKGMIRNAKPILHPDGSETNRYIDIIVHKRDYSGHNDYFCIEFKKWNNTSKKESRKDRNNLVRMTWNYGYLLGFHVILGKKMDQVKWTIIENGKIIRENETIFPM